MTRYERGYEVGLEYGDGMLNSRIAAEIKNTAAQIRNSITLAVFDRPDVGAIEYGAGFIAGIADRINL